MSKIHINDLILSFQDSNILWLLIPIFFIGIITDKYQEEFGTSVGNAISNGALIIFTGFSWLQLITSRGPEFPPDIAFAQIFFTIFIISYGFSIVASGFRKGEFAKKYGRIRVITFMLIFFTMMIYVPLLFNFVSIILFVLLFPFYYAFITELIKVMPSATKSKGKEEDWRKELKKIKKKENNMNIARRKFEEYFN